MDAAGTVLDDGVIYIQDSAIVAVLPGSVAAPPGFEGVARVRTGCTLYPGLIELHNHLPYDVLGLWEVPRPFTNREQWSSASTPDYHRLISGPMGVLGRLPDVVAAVVRYVEVRCLLAGTTTSQGVALASNPGIVTHFRGLVRNVESTGTSGLPAAATHIANIDATDAEHFMARISGRQKLLLHLAEGIDDAARNHFLALQMPNGEWAITENLIGIHCAALRADDFQIFADHGASMVWSPLSNLLLYGQTADIAAALAAHVPIALGSDWAPSGSKNLLSELKVARLAAGTLLSGRDLAAMVTTTPAKMLGWDGRLGSLEAGKLADLIAVRGLHGDPYDLLIDATEAGIDLVVINGVARAGTLPLMGQLGIEPTSGEAVPVRGGHRLLNLAQADADPTVEAVTVVEAITRLTTALADLPNAGASAAPVSLGDGRARLAVQGVIDNHMSPRPHLPLRGALTGPNLPTPMAAVAAAVTFPALTLDPLTAVDNPNYYRALGIESNLKDPLRSALAALRPH